MSFADVSRFLTVTDPSAAMLMPMRGLRALVAGAEVAGSATPIWSRASRFGQHGSSFGTGGVGWPGLVTDYVDPGGGVRDVLTGTPPPPDRDWHGFGGLTSHGMSRCGVSLVAYLPNPGWVAALPSRRSW